MTTALNEGRSAKGLTVAGSVGGGKSNAFLLLQAILSASLVPADAPDVSAKVSLTVHVTQNSPEMTKTMAKR